MLLLTYDPNVKPAPNYVASLVSPYGSEAEYRKRMNEMWYKVFACLFEMFPRAEEKK